MCTDRETEAQPGLALMLGRLQIPHSCPSFLGHPERVYIPTWCSLLDPQPPPSPTHVLISDGEVHVPSLVVNPAGRVEDILGNCKVGHSVMLLGQPDGRSIKGNWGALALAKEFTLETEGHISHPGFLPERLSGRDIQSLPGGGLLCLGGGGGERAVSL